MGFEYPIFLYLLVLVPLAVVFLIYAKRKKALDSKKLASEAALARITQNLNPRKRVFRLILMVTALFFFLIAAAGPGERIGEEERATPHA